MWHELEDRQYLTGVDAFYTKTFITLDNFKLMMMTGSEKFTKRFALVVILTATFFNLAVADPNEQGRQVYEENCASCHGFDGVPILPASPNFSKGERMEKLDAELLKSIGDGKGPMMPPWKTALSEKERTDVLAYVRSMGVKKKTDAN